jgi:pilus assembly protein Flp/PilA
MRHVATNLRRFVIARDGATAIEYAIIAAGIAAAIVTTVTALGGSLSTLWGLVANIFS